MILPSASDIVQVIEATIVRSVEPYITDTRGLSATATIKHLLRNVVVRLEKEGAILLEDMDRQRALIGQIADYLIRAGDEGNGRAVRDALTAIPDRPVGYPTLDALSDIGVALRNQFHHALKALQALRETHADDGTYIELRAAVRAHIEWQVAEETTLIAPAFFGQGPRR